MKRPWAAAARDSALTSLLFLVIYNACNHLTHLRPDVGLWAFAWESRWPVIPAMIVPYWSIDLLFVIGPFLCTTREELATHRRRLVFVMAGAALGFLLIPLQFAFPRPQVEGIFAPWFTALYSFDFPHNLFPSLHIALRTLLTDLYVRKSRGVWRGVTHVWFSLIGISTLVTWQHHVVDILGGFWIAGIALHLFRFDSAAPPRAVNRTVALLYAVAAVAFSQLARGSWPWTFILVWPAFALGTAAFGYCGYGSIYRKRDGRLTTATKILFAPLLAGQWLSWRHYRRQSPRWSEIEPRVWIGVVLCEGEAREAVASGVTAVLDITTEFSEPAAFRAVKYLHLPVFDLTAPTQAQLRDAVDFIERESRDGIVHVHCKAGYSRSAAAVAAWLLATSRAKDAEDAFRQLLAKRPRIVIRPEIRAAIREFSAGVAPSRDT